MSLRKYHDVALAANDAAAYTTRSRSHRNLILIAILLNFSGINLEMMYNQNIGK